VGVRKLQREGWKEGIGSEYQMLAT
jgi:hypothetical protein